MGPSPIAGAGLFVTAPIAAGTVVIRLGGHLVSTAELHALFAEADRTGRYVDTITAGDDLHLVLPAGTRAHYANHCCDPSMWHVGPFELATRRALEAGDELTVDYATHSSDATFRMDCACGAATCRGEITGEDWRRPDLQARYAGHWIPELAARIAAEA